MVQSKLNLKNRTLTLLIRVWPQPSITGFSYCNAKKIKARRKIEISAKRNRDAHTLMRFSRIID